MAIPPKIVHRSDLEQAERYVVLYERAARSYAGELSEAKDEPTRTRLAKKLDEARRQAEFYRGIVTSAPSD